MSIDPIDDEYPWWSPYQFAGLNPIKYIDIDGLEPGYINPTTRLYYPPSDQMKQPVPKSAIFLNAEHNKSNILLDLIEITDLNDATVIVTGITRNGNAVNIKEEPQDDLDKVFAFAGAVIPVVSGSLLKKVAKGIAKLAGDKVDDVIKNSDEVADAVKVKKVEKSVTKTGDYSNIPDPKNAGPGKKFTEKQKKQIKEQNKLNNDGIFKSDESGSVLNNSKRNIKGQKADMNQIEVDHKISRAKGGTNSNSNAQVVSKKENLKKGTKSK